MRLSEDGKILLKVANSDIKEDGSFDIPDGVNSIDDFVFNGCIGLQTITIPEVVTSIGHYAFFDCSRLQAITIPESVTSIGNGAFRGCIGLQSITIPENVTSIGHCIFYGCSGLQAITIPKSVTSIGNCAFRGCISLQSVIIPEGVTSIGVWAFGGCIGLQIITIPEGVTSIGSWAFSGCIGLQTITIPEGVVSIGDEAFSNCSSLHSIMISGKEDASIERIINLLPDYLRDKVILKDVAEAAFQKCKAQLSRVAQTSEINPLYRYFNCGAGYISEITVKEDGKNICSKLPDDIFKYINGYLVNDNPYYKKAKTRMHQVPLPKNKDEIKAYENALESIANECIAKAKEFSNSLFLVLPKGLRESLSQLRGMTLKKEDKQEGYLNIADAVNNLHQKILQSFEKTFPTDVTQFKKECKDAIEKVQLVLAGEGYQPVTVTGQHFSFFKAEVAEKVSALENTVRGIKNF
ncbi:leucine-rich repeat domain-containing protein [Legionella clemsonensis]|uniref:Leucine-rich repeat domain-containing protein n=1 Tax=Legionella clemsonensis TaxID=1867846 RepID=A0A222P2E1_9GAMM|nr:leucine-rich repeat domain-containing protein [Legionella clemsonensis]ASQ45997.1 hypothetical protein clem_07220 [Legionella clemsonensis]